MVASISHMHTEAKPVAAVHMVTPVATQTSWDAYAQTGTPESVHGNSLDD